MAEIKCGIDGKLYQTSPKILPVTETSCWIEFDFDSGKGVPVRIMMTPDEAREFAECLLSELGPRKD